MGDDGGGSSGKSQKNTTENEKKEKEERLILAAIDASKNSYSPYSRFAVGAALLTTSGKIFPGTNVENASYGGTICAERSAICSAISQGERAFVAMAVVAYVEGEPCSPCGICRQFMAEFGLDCKVLLYSPKSGKRAETTVQKLLPCAFTPNALLPSV